jgi:DNA modification methylase
MAINILQGDCIESLKKLEDQSINTCITSPPYWGLRNYNDEEKQLGMEDTPEEFTENLVKVFKEVKRVLRDDGTVWLNLGDSYGKNKQLTGIPWRVAFALQQDGWYLRQDIIWHKPNPMPESVTNRCTKAHEYIFLLSKKPKYYYDHEAIKEDAKYPQGPNSPQSIKKGKGEFGMDTRGGLSKIGALAKKNKRSVWTVTTKPFKGAHFATFPKDLIEPCVLAGCPEKMCCECGTPYKRQMQKTGEFQRSWSKTIATAEGSPHEGQSSMQNIYEDLGLQKQCDCQTNETKAGTVLDPFGGSGTTGIVAAQHNRNAVLLELNQEYIDLAKARINKEVDND